MAEELIWTVLPNGRHNGKLRATLYLSPRLSGGNKLDEFDIMRSWPEQLVDGEGKWKVAFNLNFSGQIIAAKPYRQKDGPRKNYRPDSELWSALLPGDTFVNDFSFKDLSTRRIHSFPTLNIKSLIDLQYKGAARISPTELPETKTLLKDAKLREISLFQPIQLEEGAEPTLFAPGGEVKDYGEVARSESNRLGRVVSADEVLMKDIRIHVDKETDRLFDDATVGKVKAVPAAKPNARSDFMQLKRFHVTRKEVPSEKVIEPPKLDFHGIITAYGQHPALMRLLGLAIDVEFDELPPATGVVWLETNPGNLQTKALHTNYQFTTDAMDSLAFIARPEKESEIESCCVGVGEKAFSVIHLDVNGAGEKAMRMAVDVQRSSITKSVDTKKRIGLPALQTAGLSLIRTGAAPTFVKRFEIQKALNEKLESAQETQLWADDILRGYRVDVLDGTSNEWRSVCRRKTSYSRKDIGRNWFEDYEINDGWISSAVTESVDDDDDDLYLQESLFRWNGWSLVAPRPGNTLSKDYQSVKQTSEPAQELNLDISTEPSRGSLPRLRYGYPYKIRLRAVDLAGNSLTIADANDLIKGDSGDKLVVGSGYVYRRMEPIAQPVLLAHDPLEKSNGESVERLVIRTFNFNPDLDGAPTSQFTQRHVLPTGASQLMSEMHGQFDDAAGHPIPASYQAIVAHDSPLPNSDGVYTQNNVAIPYLPDPAGRGAAFSNIPMGDAPKNNVYTHLGNGKIFTSPLTPTPETETTVFQIDFGPPKAWPDLKSFRLVMAGGNKPKNPKWDAKKREFVIYIQPGEIRKVRMSSFLLEKDLEKFEAWNWLTEENKAEAFKSNVIAGLHWALTPFRELTLVHAVQQPLVTPQFSKLRSVRKRGDTSAILIDTFPIDGRSTLKVDINGSWKDIDDSGDEPRILNGQAFAFEYPLEYEKTNVALGPKFKLQRFMVNPQSRGIINRDALKSVRLGDTKKAASILKRSAVVASDKTPRKVVSVAQLSKVAKSGMRVANFVDTEALKRGKKPVTETDISRHEFGDTRYRKVNYMATATTRFLEYMPFYQQFVSFQKSQIEKRAKGNVVRLWEAKSPKQAFTRRSKPVAVEVLSSARPPAPEIEYVIPTFGWEKQTEGDSTSSKRSGGGLRVYLKRPWFASGVGELLGVVVGQLGRQKKDKGKRAKGDLLKPYITQWGMDPIWRSAATPSLWSPSLQNFRNTASTESNLTLEELPEARVSVAGFDVGTWDDNGELTGYDSERQLWFCDIELDPGESYFPFVRLALVRYQPKSLSWKGDRPGDVKLSRVVLTDFNQLTPDRFANVTTLSNSRLKLVVTGHTYLESGVDKYGEHIKQETTERAVSLSTQSNSTIQADSTNQVARSSATQKVLNVARAVFLQSTSGSTMEVSLESSTSDSTEPLSWRPEVDSTIQLKRIFSDNAWSGEIPLPEPVGNLRYRLIIKEFEWFISDPQNSNGIDRSKQTVESRIVYADALEI